MYIWIFILSTFFPIGAESLIQSQGNRQMTGTLCSLQGGPSVLAAGQIHLNVNGDVYVFHYEKPYPHNFLKSNCLDIGAIWTVTAQMKGIREAKLLSAACAGETDKSVGPAVAKAKQFLDAMERQSFQAAYALFSINWRSKHSLEQFTEQYKILDLSFYKDHGRSGNCLEVAEGYNQDAVTIRAGGECAVFGLQGPPRVLTFYLKKKAAEAWEIDGMTESEFSGRTAAHDQKEANLRQKRSGQ
jgi:hypothetical protein